MPKITIKELIICSIILGLINLVFFQLTKANGWVSDDYSYVFGIKLFNLINNQTYFIKEAFLYQETRFVPLYWISLQIISDAYVNWHGFVIFLYFLSSIIVFCLAKKITSRSNIALLSSVLYTVHYSISIKSLSWNIFYGHILNSVLGFASIFIFLLFLEKEGKNIAYLLLYILFASLGCLIMESGLVYPLIALVLVVVLKKEKIISNTILSLLPIIIYILMVFLSTGKLLPLLTERLSSERSIYYSKIFNKEKDNNLHYYRSPYAPRNLKGISLRTFDNLLSSINFSSLEKSLKSYDKNNYFKEIIKNNLVIFLSLFLLLLILFIFFILKKISKIEDKIALKQTCFLYLFVFFIYNFILFRKDLNIALSFPSTLIISILIVNFYKNKEKIIAIFMLVLFIFPSFLYATTNFEYYGDFESRRIINKKITMYDELASQGKLDKNMEGYDNYKYLFYYKNYDKYEKYLSKYKNMPLRQFTEKFYANE